jgi:8-oxo-dGTP pyrophosphatase MutT (NUDIX family)
VRLAVDPQWRAALLARANQLPLRPRSPLLWQQHVIGSVEADFFDPLISHQASLARELLQLEHSGGGSHWRLLGDATFALNTLADALRALGVGRVRQHWRNELLAVCDAQGQRIASVERGICRPLGIATSAVHLVGCTSDGRFWVQQRSLDKANDPGLWDTLMGGMVSAQDSLESALARETWEEAGLRLDAMTGLRRGGEVMLRKPSSDGADAGYVIERVDWYGCIVPDGVQPLNQDGEVAQFALLEVPDLIERLQRDEFTTEAALILECALGAA